MKKLYTDDGHYTEDGMRVSEEILRFVRQLFASKLVEGCHARELGALGHAAIEDAVLGVMGVYPPVPDDGFEVPVQPTPYVVGLDNSIITAHDIRIGERVRRCDCDGCLVADPARVRPVAPASEKRLALSQDEMSELVRQRVVTIHRALNTGVIHFQAIQALAEEVTIPAVVTKASGTSTEQGGWSVEYEIRLELSRPEGLHAFSPSSHYGEHVCGLCGCDRDASQHDVRSVAQKKLTPSPCNGSCAYGCVECTPFGAAPCSGFYDDGVMPTPCTGREGCGRNGCPALPSRGGTMQVVSGNTADGKTGE